jgi:DNA polymerase-3 subunit epsilon
MNIAIFYDTETTGLPLFKEPSEHPDQPHIVQLAGCLVDLDTRKTIASMDVIVKPDGWTISHGLSRWMWD